MVIPKYFLLAIFLLLICKVSSSELEEPLLGPRVSSSSSNSRSSSPKFKRLASPKKTMEEIHIANAIKHEKEAEHHKSERLKWRQNTQESNSSIYRVYSEAKAMIHADEKFQSLKKAKKEREKAVKAKQQEGTSRS
ncbi:uncharacterized protein FA14DRAFT_155163 [Meira miltonrushii]|uniref:Uncharacterized protein n=1 Tax=Meira miltonrushii TaxID=1280837 RepID=A0A316VHD8_9BASI|nr:uncharacterized protein FA14DRAFT_155163 [Meira miltonrushii]PWN35753.1 hypothetical protein FA14DRAFT_155163 [Meira miltonrushii]